MRILFVVHYYLPWHQAGTELYTRALVRKFKKEGHQVWVFTSEDQARPGFSLKTDEYEGVKIYRLYHPGALDFKSSYLQKEFDQIFGRLLDQLKPELIHFQHLLRLSLGFIYEAEKRKIPTLMTLADYWLICPAIIMLKPNDEPCAGPELSSTCVNCPHSFSAFYPGLASEAKSKMKQMVESGLAFGHKLKRQLPPQYLDWLREKLGKKEHAEEKSFLLQERWNEMKNAVEKLSLLIAPSKFLREMMLKSQMVPEKKIIHSDYGFEPNLFPEKMERKLGQGPLSLGFIGTLVRHKGLHILLQAMKLIPEKNLELKIFGEEKDFPGYVHHLKKIAGKDPRIKWRGRIENDQIAEALSQIDLLVVPSIWYENSPLTIHEAFLAKVPVLTSDLGGMAELIQTGGGLSFQPKDPQSLAQKIQELSSSPQKLSGLKKNIPPVKNIDQNYQELLNLYQSLLAT